MLEAYAGMLAIIATFFGAAMSFAYIPQAYKIWKRKSVADISIILFSVLFSGVLIWLFYGISINNIPLIITNSIGATTIGIIIVEYFIYRK
jgi:MtN3 and saliva related transmembrane protein